MVDESYREMTGSERELFDRLLSQSFPGRDEVAIQLAHSRVRTIDENGGLEIHVDSQVIAATTNSRVPIEGEATDTDGITIHFLLHVVDGVVAELEVYKEDNSRIAKMPAVDTVRVFASA